MLLSQEYHYGLTTVSLRSHYALRFSVFPANLTASEYAALSSSVVVSTNLPRYSSLLGGLNEGLFHHFTPVHLGRFLFNAWTTYRHHVQNISSSFTCRTSIVQLDVQHGIIFPHHLNCPQIRADVLCLDEVLFKGSHFFIDRLFFGLLTFVDSDNVAVGDDTPAAFRCARVIPCDAAVLASDGLLLMSEAKAPTVEPFLSPSQTTKPAPPRPLSSTERGFPDGERNCRNFPSSLYPSALRWIGRTCPARDLTAALA